MGKEGEGENKEAEGDEEEEEEEEKKHKKEKEKEEEEKEKTGEGGGGGMCEDCGGRGGGTRAGALIEDKGGPQNQNYLLYPFTEKV